MLITFLKSQRLTIAMCLALLLVMLLKPMHAIAYFNLDEIYDGQLWRLVSGHFIHADWEHLAWNGVALLVLGGVIERESRPLLISSVLLGVLGVNLWLLSPLSDIELYCGLSGVLNSVLVVALYVLWQKTASPWIILSGVLCMAKIVVEIAFNDSMISHISWPPYPQAHFAGAVAGLLVCILSDY